jgi:hypothetical protein
MNVAVPETPFGSVAVTVTVYVPNVLPAPEIVPFDAIATPGGRPDAVKVRACDASESAAWMAKETPRPSGCCSRRG